MATLNVTVQDEVSTVTTVGTGQVAGQNDSASSNFIELNIRSVNDDPVGVADSVHRERGQLEQLVQCPRERQPGPSTATDETGQILTIVGLNAIGQTSCRYLRRWHGQLWPDRRQRPCDDGLLYSGSGILRHRFVPVYFPGQRHECARCVAVAAASIPITRPLSRWLRPLILTSLALTIRRGSISKALATTVDDAATTDEDVNLRLGPGAGPTAGIVVNDDVPTVFGDWFRPARRSTMSACKPPVAAMRVRSISSLVPGVTIVAGANNSSDVTLQGQVVLINQVLSHSFYVPKANLNGAWSIRLRSRPPIRARRRFRTARRPAISINALNDAPTAFFSPNLVVVPIDNGGADTGARTVTGFITAPPSVGPADEQATQTIVSSHITSFTNPGLFASGPILSGGDLTAPRDLNFTVSPGVTGTSTVTITTIDTGPTGPGASAPTRIRGRKRSRSKWV